MSLTTLTWEPQRREPQVGEAWAYYGELQQQRLGVRQETACTVSQTEEDTKAGVDMISQQKFFPWSYFCGTSDSEPGSPFLSIAATIVQQGDREQEGVQSLGKPLVII